MDMKDRVEFVALTKEEIESMIAKAALAGASVAAETMEKAYRKEQKELKDRRLHNTRLLLRNYRMLKESCSKAVYSKTREEKSAAEVMEDLMSMKGSDGVIVNSIKEQALVYKYEDLTESQKKKLMIADNKIFSLGIENLDTLNEFLEELNGDLDIPGFDEEILKQMVADADEVTEKISEYGTLDEEEIQQIKEANEKREQKELESASEEGKAIVQTDLPQQGGQSATMESPESAETRRFVICPKCGEQIWL